MDDDECIHGLGPVSACGPVMAEFNRLVMMETDDCIVWPHYRRGKYGFVRVGRLMVGVHVLALERRVGPRPEGTEAAHTPKICHRPSCMNYRHLRWATPAENKADMVVDGTRLYGRLHGRAKLTESDVRSIRRRHATGETQTALAREYAVGRSTIRHAIGRDTWRHI